MTHENNDCLPKQQVVPVQAATRENVFDRVRPRAPLPSRGHDDRAKDEVSYRPHREGLNSSARVQRSSHSARLARTASSRDNRFKPYSYVCNTDKIDRSKEPIWKEKQQALKIVDQTRERSDTSLGPTSAMMKEKLSDPMSDKSMLTKTKETEPPIDQNVTFRPASSRSQDSTMEDHADTLIPPYNALKIDALAEYDMDQEDDFNDAAMEENPGTELALMEEDDLLGEDLQNMDSNLTLLRPTRV
ncbi:Uncharacterized protein Rs2_29068 [Raphanus sativus]|nr:Uncharacterized protein Rs2_29068 [Raphanus sativus]